ncbi:MAG: M20/M25/M40 family metallo-hydrolase [Pseudomonadota bacterium]
MKYATFSSSGRSRKTLRRSLDANSGWWVQFGDDLFVYAANAKWAAVSEAMGARDARQPQGDVRKSALHLVVQKGRTFQQEHPDVPVLFDKGRYLVVDLAPAAARKLRHDDEVCFDILPLRENAVVFESFDKGRAGPQPAAAASVVAQVAESRFAARLAHLVSYPTRFSTSSGYAEAAAWAEAELAAMGYVTRQEPVAMPGGGASSNVIATKTGQGADRKELIVVAHLDSVNHPGGPPAPAPGADDNASGSAGLLELAEVCAGLNQAHDLTLILFGGEEQGLHGSRQYVAGLSAAARQRIAGVLNMDMIGSVNATPPAVLLEGAALSQAQIDALAASAVAHTGLEVQTSLNPFASDHVPFIEAEIPAVLTIEGADSANDAIHTANDTLDRVDTGFATEILRMNAGYLAVALEASVAVAPDPPQPQPQPQPAGDCGCGCGGGGGCGDGDAAAQIRQLATHYQALMAQYARLGPMGLLTQQDLAAWQGLRQSHDSLLTGLGARQGS